MKRRKKTLADYSPRQLAGLKGFWTVCVRYYQSDARAMVNALIWRGLRAQDPMPENGAWTTARIPDRLPKYWREPPLHPHFLDNPPF